MVQAHYLYGQVQLVLPRIFSLGILDSRTGQFIQRILLPVRWPGFATLLWNPAAAGSLLLCNHKRNGTAHDTSASTPVVFGKQSCDCSSSFVDTPIGVDTALTHPSRSEVLAELGDSICLVIIKGVSFASLWETMALNGRSLEFTETRCMLT
ncbi:uncharacterized protein ARMOST_06080 [Armillaria ostoyae]|uniref:Uncharacterized protein n=1 Tax=Armillaria ostoyae TaxID=47428 RepID=A0A284R1Z2_ARMOS|nr:uncharacterized protein ARMOST_06080 [Armillaria ostoyae]